MLAATVLATSAAHAQWWDAGAAGAKAVSEQTDGKLKLGAEIRARYETRTANNFSPGADIDTGLVRTRLSLTYTPVTWLKISGMMQDARAPCYGTGAPSTVRDPADLHEGYFELFPSAPGFGMTVGRMMLNYGEGRLIGTPQWSNLSRTYDHARAYYRTGKARFEFLLVSPVKIRIDEFNRPVLGDRIWGTYNSIPDFWKRNLLDFYILRHDQNRPGGFTGGNKAAGTDRLEINTFGARVAGPLPWRTKYSIETALQNGTSGAAAHRAGAWYSSIARRWITAGKPLDVSAEYKFASGTGNPQETRTDRTFDQLYAANHDKFGHEDLFGWRNMSNVRSLATWSLSKHLTLNVMYDRYWLASARDSLYNGAGRAIARSATGAAGRDVGQEADIFTTYGYGHFLVGAGYGHFFAGDFIRRTTPGAGPVYLYIFHTYSF
jgi:hypothetical protein